MCEDNVVYLLPEIEAEDLLAEAPAEDRVPLLRERGPFIPDAIWPEGE